MAEDRHLGTGEYDPEKYWNARARTSAGNLYKAVCGYGVDDDHNRAMERVQLSVLASTLRDVSLRSSRVVEVGCGLGRLAPWFKRRSARYTGVDIAAEMLSLARVLSPGGPFARADSSRLPFADDSIDLACTITVLHHNPYERQDAMLTELVRVVRPGGFLLLMESIRPQRSPANFHVFPRPVDDWLDGVVRDGRATLRRVELCRWSLLRDGAGALVRRATGGRAAVPGAIDRALIRAGGHVDPWLLPLLPEGLARTACMLFETR